MKRKMNQLLTAMAFAMCLIVCGMSTAKADNNFGEHPFYLRALSDLRAARWMLYHTPGDWMRSREEEGAIREIDAAINEIRQASIDDHKDIMYHPPIDEPREHVGRLQQAIFYLQKAREDVGHEEDNFFARGLRNRAFRHIDEAIRFTRTAKHV